MSLDKKAKSSFLEMLGC